MEDSHQYDDISRPREEEDEDPYTAIEDYILPTTPYEHIYQVPQHATPRGSEPVVKYNNQKTPDVVLVSPDALGDTRRHDKRTEGPREREKCRPPWWAVTLMVIGVLVLAAIIVGIVYVKVIFDPDPVMPTTHGTGSSTTMRTAFSSTTRGTSRATSIRTSKGSTRASTTKVTSVTPSTSDLTRGSTRASTTKVTSVTPSSLFPAPVEDESVFTLTASTESDTNKISVPGQLTLEDCKTHCIQHSPFCYGLDYNVGSRACYVIETALYSLKPIGSKPGTDNYRRDLSARSTCEVTFFTNNNRRLEISDVIQQPADIDTIELCKDLCLGPGRDALLASGDTCYGVAFDTENKTCYVSTTFQQRSTKQDRWVYAYQRFVCASALYAGCDYRYWKLSNMNVREEVEGDSLVVPDARDVSDCSDQCIAYTLTRGNRCRGFTFDRRNATCTIYSGWNGLPSLSPIQGIDVYPTSASSCVNCGDLYDDSASKKGTDGILQNGSFNIWTCKTLCNGYERRVPGSKKCYGFDFTSSTRECHINTVADYQLRSVLGTTNYRRRPICRRCSTPTRYHSTINTNPPGGIVFSGTSFNSVRWCGYLCQGQSVSFTSATCFGFSFDKRNKRCYLYRSFDYDVGSVGTSEGFDHYRRQFICPTGTCKDTYTLTINARGAGSGDDQPQDINTVELCKDRCYGYAIGTFGASRCYGFDFNSRTNLCTIFTTDKYLIGFFDDAVGISNYRRNDTCG